MLVLVGGRRPYFLSCFHCGAGEAPFTIGKEKKEKDKKEGHNLLIPVGEDSCESFGLQGDPTSQP